MSIRKYFLKPYICYRYMKFEVDLSNYATKNDVRKQQLLIQYHRFSLP